MINQLLYSQLKRNKMGLFSLFVILLFLFFGIYAPLFASSKPFIAIYRGEIYFPFFRYLFFQGFYRKWIDLFFNLLMFTLPFMLIFYRQKKIVFLLIVSQFLLFFLLINLNLSDPARDVDLSHQRQALILQAAKEKKSLFFSDLLPFMPPYEKLLMVLNQRRNKRQHERLISYFPEETIPSLYQMARKRAKDEQGSFASMRFAFLENEIEHVSFALYPLASSFHWEEDAGGSRHLNRVLPWYELTSINRKDLVSLLFFGIRVSITVGFLSVFISLLIGIPVGAFAGYYSKSVDIVVCRILEVWEAMPTFFMLLMAVSILQNKSIVLVILVIGFFGWMGISRFVRAEFLKQRSLPYVEAARCIGFSDRTIIFSDILPNAIHPVLTLVPFAIMGAITSEAGLSFLGLGEEGSASLGNLMNEGRIAFPYESYLLWPPAITLTILLVAIALFGDAIRDSLDPKLSKRETPTL